MGQLEHRADEWRLLKAVAEQLKLPLLQLARGAELNGLAAEPVLTWLSLQASANAALAMVDNYLFGLEVVENQLSLMVEPVSMPMVLNEVAHELTPLAREYKIELELVSSGKLTPVMANRLAIRTVLLSLGQALVSAPATVQRPVLRLVACRQSDGVATGVFGDVDLSAQALRQARQLYGRSTQPLTQLGSSAAGIFVADTILGAMAAPLKARRYQHQAGLAVTLPLSRQLELV
jgi:hypothetical protein